MLDEAARNGVDDVLRLRADEILALEPRVNPVTLGGLHIPRESITCSPRLAVAYAENAVLNGAQVSLGEPLLGLQPVPGGLLLTTARRTLRTRWAVNAAGLHADEVARFAGDDS